MSTLMSGAHPLPSLQDRINVINERIHAAAEKSGRPAEAVTLLAVTKTVPAERINEVMSLGVLNIGENKIQEAVAKRPLLSSGHSGVHHFIGHLQTNKARKAVEYFDVIQSVDSPKLAQALDKIAGDMGKHQRVLAEIKLSDEPHKTGIPLEDAGEFMKTLSRYSHLDWEGLMMIAPYGLNPEDTRRCFRRFVQFAETVKGVFRKLPVLSFGMSDDFEMAVEEGSTMVRIGRSLFGERPPAKKGAA